MPDIKTIAVIGAGLMGNGIAQVALTAGYDVTLIDVFPAALQKGLAAIEGRFQKSVEKGKLTAEAKAELMSRLQGAGALADANGKDVVIEAVPELIDLKIKVFEELGQVTGPETVLVSNTSGLSLTRLGAAAKRADKVIGMHFFYPAPVMKLVEVIRGLGTSDETYQTVWALAQSFGKTPVNAPDHPGFVVNRLLVPMMNEAIFLVQEGAKPEDVDTAMKLGCNHPMGPLELADFTGLDVTYNTMQGLFEQLKEEKYRPCPLLKKMVEGGYLGRKSGRGFYQY
ncbi:MAG TPA: 3-hydroxyacyl-CoA dehydrogenase NAD-binding domain-containing protein [Symbiobacteriaceae bacterium]|nr:3-hydroxyacyl-CoA dehydrogenase NAD-binding domain-containing protein [Symbiobacteriaceae bacterium]